MGERKTKNNQKAKKVYLNRSDKSRSREVKKRGRNWERLERERERPKKREERERGGLKCKTAENDFSSPFI